MTLGLDRASLSCRARICTAHDHPTTLPTLREPRVERHAPASEAADGTSGPFVLASGYAPWLPLVDMDDDTPLAFSH